MPSERIQRQIDALLDEVEAAARALDWPRVRELCDGVLRLDHENEDAKAFLEAANHDTGVVRPLTSVEPTSRPDTPTVEHPSSFVAGRYAVRRFLGEGGKKRVYLAHDEQLDRDVAFALIKTEGLDEVGHERIVREAQTMGRLGAHPHVVTIFEIGDEGGAPYVVTELLGGGDVEGLLAKEGGALPLARTLEIAKGVARGLAFAHQQGVVHRDLKPGNVWLTTEGVAKIGDFGLAVALDRSRLTTHGLMVGTVAYMPPEQALGGDVTPQADLYSLGAMLYELVTGKPPFAGDSPTAIISQHINTPPVAPSWNSEHCPPDLEALILKLLAKVAADRPASASEVIEALERVDPEARSASHSDSSANPLDRLARGVFVGRERELERLRSAFDGAFAGRGSVVMLVGEPGIGKTRTTQELSTYARMRGAHVLWGRTHEAGGAPPYWPWIQVGNAWGGAVDVLGSGMSRLQGVNIGELARLFPPLRQVPGFVEPPELADGAAGQFRLFDAFTQFVRVQTQDRPWLVVLDDLHWADRPTLQLLSFIARDLPSLRMLIVGAYRDTELARTHPLSETLAELNREGGFLRLPLRGLTREELRDYIRASAGSEPTQALITRIHEETEGNPFFLSEVVNLLAQEQRLNDSVSDIALPEGVKEALGRRLDRLSEEADALLSFAAVAGRDFDYDTMRLLGQTDEDALLKLLEEGIAARVIEESGRPGAYRFTHALMQETLLDELSTTRKVRMHGQVAEALERRLGDRAEEQAARLALHYGEAATLNVEHAERALRFGALAADAAYRQSAWADAARHYKSCIALIEAGEGRAKSDVFELLARLGTCARNEGDYRSAWRSLMRAIDGFRGINDNVGLAGAVLDAVQILAPMPSRISLLEEALDRLGVAEPHLEARLNAQLLAVLGTFESSASAEDAAPRRRRANELQQLYGFADVEAMLRFVDALAADLARDLDAGERLYMEAHSLLDSTGLLRTAAEAAQSGARLALSSGALDRGGERTEQARRYAQRRHIRLYEQNATSAILALRLARWELVEFDELAAQYHSDADYYFHTAEAARALVTGDRELALSLLPDPAQAGGAVGISAQIRAGRARIFASAGALEVARVEFADVVEAATNGLLRWPFVFGQLDDALGRLVEDGAFLDAAVQFAASADSDNQVWYWVNGTSAKRTFAQIALRSNDLAVAERRFVSALDWCERERCPVEAGRCHQGLAEVAERRGDIEEARTHLDAAGALFAKHGAKLYLDQVLAKKQVLGA